jgi:p-aminobenzoyl-glutamate transporter AbgT
MLTPIIVLVGVVSPPAGGDGGRVRGRRRELPDHAARRRPDRDHLLIAQFIAYFNFSHIPDVAAAFRVGDSPSNVISPLNPYFALVVIFAQRYDKSFGIGSLVSMMLPYTVIVTLAWTLFFLAWYLIGLPLGPGWPVRL